MRKFIRLLLMLLLFAAIFPFVYPWKDGKPMLSWSDIRMPTMPEITLPELPKPGEATRESNQPVTLYRWQGPDGSTQFGSEPPAEGINYEVVAVNPDANLIQALPPSEAPVEAEEKEGGNSTSLPSPLTVSPGEAMQLMEDAKNIREMSEERLRQHEALAQ